MYMYLLLFTACLNVETEVQCTAVPSTLTLWMETKWSNPLLIRNLRWHADVTGIYKGKNIHIILKCNSPTFTISTEYVYFYSLINSKFQPLPPEEPTGIWLSSIQEGGIWTLPGRGWELQMKVQVLPWEQTLGSECQIHIF